MKQGREATRHQGVDVAPYLDNLSAALDATDEPTVRAGIEFAIKAVRAYEQKIRLSRLVEAVGRAAFESGNLADEAHSTHYSDTYGEEYLSTVRFPLDQGISLDVELWTPGPVARSFEDARAIEFYVDNADRPSESTGLLVEAIGPVLTFNSADLTFRSKSVDGPLDVVPSQTELWVPDRLMNLPEEPPSPPLTYEEKLYYLSQMAVSLGVSTEPYEAPETAGAV